MKNCGNNKDSAESKETLASPDIFIVDSQLTRIFMSTKPSPTNNKSSTKRKVSSVSGLSRRSSVHMESFEEQFEKDSEKRKGSPIHLNPETKRRPPKRQETLALITVEEDETKIVWGERNNQENPKILSNDNPPRGEVNDDSSFYCIPYFFKKRPVLTLFTVMIGNLLISMISAAIFIELEYPAQARRLKSTSLLEDEVKNLRLNLTNQIHENVQEESLVTFKTYSEQLKILSEKMNNKEIMWDMLSACAFVSAVSSTTGYGDIVPVTLGGKIFTIIYALYGIPIFIWYIVKLGALFRAVVMRIIFTFTDFSGVLCNLSSRLRMRNTLKNVLATVSNPIKVKPNLSKELTDDKRFHPSIIGIILLLFMVSVAAFISYMEGITYFDAFYACFITYSTIGFGDIDIYRISFRSNWFNLMIYGNFIHVVGYMIVSAWISSILDKCGVRKC